MGIEAYIAAAYVASCAQAAASERAIADAAKKQHQWGLTYEDPMLKKRRESTTPGKCASCGSRQFQHHNSFLICSYCRSHQ
jgi:hypothetical protein